ncbi:MAG: GIY-YIG nuclease family protein [Verrucomicrobia bacterium]|nr:GIY-YIG nuclease family protein [Prolixibacteraceae bacterium]
MKFYSYVIYSQTSGSFYHGYFDDLEKVLEMHNSDLIAPTKGRGPWVLMHSEGFDNRLKAIRQVSFYRSVKGQRFLRNMLNF